MKRFINLFIVVMTVFVLSFACVPNTTQAQISSAGSALVMNETVLVAEYPVDLKFIRAQSNGVSFQFVGMVASCLELVEVVGLTVYNDEDSSYIRTNPYDTFSQMVDTCIIQMFCFTVHGGSLRKHINKSGLATIYLLTLDNRACRIQLTEFGEEEIIRVLDNK